MGMDDLNLRSLNDARGKKSLIVSSPSSRPQSAMTFNPRDAQLVQIEWQSEIAADASKEWSPKVAVSWHRGQAVFSMRADAEFGSICIPAEGDVQVTAWDAGGGSPGASPMPLYVGWYPVANPVEWQAIYTIDLGTIAGAGSSPIVDTPPWTTMIRVDCTVLGVTRDVVLVGYKQLGAEMARNSMTTTGVEVTNGGTMRKLQVVNSGAIADFSIVCALRRKSL